MIKSGGKNIASRAVEEALYRHAAISEVAVTGLPDLRWIEAVTAMIVLRKGHQLTVDDVLINCAAHLSSFRVPQKVVFLDNFPCNASGKIFKRVLPVHAGRLTRRQHAPDYAAKYEPPVTNTT